MHCHRLTATTQPHPHGSSVKTQTRAHVFYGGQSLQPMVLGRQSPLPSKSKKPRNHSRVDVSAMRPCRNVATEQSHTKSRVAAALSLQLYTKIPPASRRSSTKTPGSVFYKELQQQTTTRAAKLPVYSIASALSRGVRLRSERMSPLSRPSLIQTRNDTATRPTIASLPPRPTLVAASTGQLSGYNVSSSNISSTLLYQTNFSTRTASATPSAALITPLSYANHSTSAVITTSSTHIVSIVYTTNTLKTSLSSPTLDLTLSAESPMPTLGQTHEITLETKIGLALIPLAAGLCAWGLVLFFLWRRRRMHASHHKLESSPITLPEKSRWQSLPLLNDSIKGGRIFTVTAFHSSDNWENEAQVIGQRSTEGFHEAASATPPPVRRAPPGGYTGAWNQCSPIYEETTPQLRRGESTRRSLGEEISDLWPSPPPTAWARRQDFLNQLPLSRFGRDMNRPNSPRSPRSSRSPRFSSRKSQQEMRDINRPLVAENWPLL